MSEVETGYLDELAFGAQTLEEEDQFQLEEDDRIDGGTPVRGITLLHPITHEGEIEFTLEMAIEVIQWNQGFE